MKNVDYAGMNAARVSIVKKINVCLADLKIATQRKTVADARMEDNKREAIKLKGLYATLLSSTTNHEVDADVRVEVINDINTLLAAIEEARVGWHAANSERGTANAVLKRDELLLAELERDLAKALPAITDSLGFEASDG